MAFSRYDISGNVKRPQNPADEERERRRRDALVGLTPSTRYARVDVPVTPAPRPPAPRAPGPVGLNPGAATKPGMAGIHQNGTATPGLSDLDRSQFAERQAYDADLKSQAAQNQQRVEARAGLAGLGLSGGTDALLGDTARVDERSRIEALAGLTRDQRDESFGMQERQFALDEAKKASGRSDIETLATTWGSEEETISDFDHDGFIGDPANKYTVAEAQEDAAKDDRALAREGLQSKDMDWFWDADTGAGTDQEPFRVTRNELDRLKSEDGLILSKDVVKSGVKTYIVYRDQDGFVYYVEG